MGSRTMSVTDRRAAAVCDVVAVPGHDGTGSPGVSEAQVCVAHRWAGSADGWGWGPVRRAGAGRECREDVSDVFIEHDKEGR